MAEFFCPLAMTIFTDYNAVIDLQVCTIYKGITQMTSKQHREKTKFMPMFDLSDPKLFGNDAADDEPEDIFRSYFYQRNDVSFFLDSNNPLAVIRAFRGEGKSAILKKAHMDIRETGMAIYSKGPNLSPDVTGTNHDKWMRGWKTSIYNRIAAEVGQKTNVALSPDSMELVRIAEEGGFRKTGLITYIASRVKADGILQINNDVTRTANFAENVLQRAKK